MICRLVHVWCVAWVVFVPSIVMVLVVKLRGLILVLLEMECCLRQEDKVSLLCMWLYWCAVLTTQTPYSMNILRSRHVTNVSSLSCGSVLTRAPVLYVTAPTQSIINNPSSSRCVCISPLSLALAYQRRPLRICLSKKYLSESLWCCKCMHLNSWSYHECTYLDRQFVV